MQHIRQELSQFEKKLQLQSFCDWLEAEEKLGRSFTEMVESILASADEDISELMDGIIIEIANKVYFECRFEIGCIPMYQRSLVRYYDNAKLYYLFVSILSFIGCTHMYVYIQR